MLADAVCYSGKMKGHNSNSIKHKSIWILSNILFIFKIKTAKYMKHLEFTQCKVSSIKGNNPCHIQLIQFMLQYTLFYTVTNINKKSEVEDIDESLKIQSRAR